MKKLIKIKSHYYVIDYEEIIYTNDFYIEEDEILRADDAYEGHNEIYKVVASTDIHLGIPLIVEDYLECLIGIVNTEFHCPFKIECDKEDSYCERQDVIGDCGDYHNEDAIVKVMKCK